MTDQDNLRDRIEDTLRDSVGYSWRNKAQAIIDDLGLTVETHAATHAKRTMTRIIGAWEWEKQ